MRLHLLHSIASAISDYRHGEIPAPTPGHVDRWVRQFDRDVQEPMLAELDHVLKHSYLSRDHVLNFLGGLLARKHLIEPSDLWRKLYVALVTFIGLLRRGKARPISSATHWQDVRFLDIQKHGGSQHEMIRLFREVLAREYGLSLPANESNMGPFLYLDDILFTGNRIIADLRQWIQADAPRRAEVVVTVIATYRRGLWYTQKKVLKAARQARKAIRFHWLRSIELEDRFWAGSGRDAFQPSVIPDTPLARAYVGELAKAGFSPRLRTSGSSAKSRLFSSEAGRDLLETQFLLAGFKIRSFCRNPQEIMRPLGYHVFKDLGFGATLVTYRNCPNNCPLALWWGDPDAPSSHPLSRWYPLFPRKV